MDYSLEAARTKTPSQGFHFFYRMYGVLLKIFLIVLGLALAVCGLELVARILPSWGGFYPSPESKKVHPYYRVPGNDRYDLPTSFGWQAASQPRTLFSYQGENRIDDSERFISSTLGPYGFRHLFAGEFSSYRSVMRKYESKEVIYDVEYKLNKFKQRITPQQTILPSGEFAMFFGGSRVYGEGVNDWETVPAQFASIASSYRVYNFGFPARSINTYVATLRKSTPPLWPGVLERKGAAFLFIFHDDLNRVMGPLTHAKKYYLDKPYFYRSSAGELKDCESFEKCRPWRSKLYQWLSQLKLLRFFHINLPLRYTSSDYDFVAQLIAEFRRLFLETFPEANFYVVFFPGIAGHSLNLREPLARRGIPFFDYGAWLMQQETDKLLYYPRDNHFTPPANSLIGQQLARDFLLKNLLYSSQAI